MMDTYDSMMSMGLVKLRDRVTPRSLGIPGIVDYIDFPHLFNDIMNPVQIILDNPYDETGHTLYRTGLKDLTGEIQQPKGGDKYVIIYMGKRRRIFMAWDKSSFNS